MSEPREEFLNRVYLRLLTEPDLFSDIVLISQKALMDRTKIESDLRSEAWAAMLTAYPHIGKKRKIADFQLDLINTVVLKASEGTQYGKDLRNGGLIKNKN
jgi:hypothetical protein